MQQTIEKLINGDQDIVGYYTKAKAYWDEILVKHPPEDTAGLAKEITAAQISRFEHDCGGRWLGQEIMAVVGIAQFYAEEGGDYGEKHRKAKLVFEAIMKSTCSIEVFGHAKAVAKEYSLTEEDEY